MFLISVWQRLRSHPSVEWRNTHVTRCEGGSGDDLQAYAECLHRLSLRFSLSSSEVTRVAVSTYSAGGHNASPAWTKSLMVTGLGSGGDPLGIEHCLQVTRTTAFGRPSFLWLRNALLRVSCTVESGILVLQAAAVNGRQSQLEYEIDRATVPGYTIGQMLSEGCGFRLVVPSSKTDGTYRYITEYTVSPRVALVRYNRR
jgi:hypothetical protein